MTDEEKVTTWLKNSDPERRPCIEVIREIIKSADSRLMERIKWNAPSYYYKEDLLTIGPPRPGKLILIFHHPAIVQISSTLLDGKYHDRRLMNLELKNNYSDIKVELQRIIRSLIDASVDAKVQ
jgi:hypothetical protein